MSKLFFIVNDSIEKSAILKAVQKKFTNSIVAYDFNELVEGYENYKNLSHKSLRKRLQEVIDDNKDICLIGQLGVSEILTAFRPFIDDDINICLLDGKSCIDDRWNCNVKVIDASMLKINELVIALQQWIVDCSVSFKFIEHGSLDYEKAISLRDRILRKPLGLSFSEDELSAEREYIHIAATMGSEIIATSVLVACGLHCKMQQVSVKESLVNCRIGSRLLEFCEAYAKKHGFQSIYCHARKSAENFYLRNNYLPEGDYFEQVTIAHIKMRKVLKAD